jgi:hypothetical protein
MARAATLARTLTRRVSAGLPAGRANSRAAFYRRGRAPAGPHPAPGPESTAAWAAPGPGGSVAAAVPVTRTNPDIRGRSSLRLVGWQRPGHVTATGCPAPAT